MAASEIRPGAARRALNWAGRRLANGGRSVWRWAGKRRRMGRVRRGIRGLEARRRELCQAIGEKVYLLFQRNHVRNRDLLALCEEIRDLDVEIDGQEEDFRRIHAEGVTARTTAPVEVADEPLEQPATVEPTEGRAEAEPAESHLTEPVAEEEEATTVTA